MFPKPAKKEKKPRKAIRRKSNSPLKIAHDRAWKWFSVWVRSKDADFNGNVKCFTCGRVKQWKATDAGHFFHNVLDFDPINVHVQCTWCNRYRQGEGVVYYEKLREMYGQEVIDDLVRRKNAYQGYTVEGYREIEAKYKSKLEGLSG